MLDTFEGIGLKMDFDDDKTPVGKVMNVMLQNPKDIACEALGVELREEKGYNVGINDDHLLPVTLEVYYPASGRGSSQSHLKACGICLTGLVRMLNVQRTFGTAL